MGAERQSHRDIILDDVLARMGAALYGDVDPAAMLSDERPLRWERHRGRPRLAVTLPGASKDHLAVTARGADLVIRLRDATRLVSLPDSVAGREVERATLQGGVLRIDFA